MKIIKKKKSTLSKILKSLDKKSDCTFKVIKVK